MHESLSYAQGERGILAIRTVFRLDAAPVFYLQITGYFDKLHADPEMRLLA